MYITFNILHSLHIVYIYDLLNGRGHCWTHCVCRNPASPRVTLALYYPPDWACKTAWSDAHFLLADEEIAADRDSDRPPGLGVHPPKALFSSGLIIFNSAKCFCCSRLQSRQMPGWKTSEKARGTAMCLCFCAGGVPHMALPCAIVPLFLCWRSTKATGIPTRIFMMYILHIDNIVHLLHIFKNHESSESHLLHISSLTHSVYWMMATFFYFSDFFRLFPKT